MPEHYKTNAEKKIKSAETNFLELQNSQNETFKSQKWGKFYPKYRFVGQL